MNRKQKEKLMCEFIGYSCQLLAAEGLSWCYSCFKDSDDETCRPDDLYGEGEILIYYIGYDSRQSEHGRLMFLAGDKEGGDDERVSMLCSWGVQGPGEHVFNPIDDNVTKKKIKVRIKEMAKWLRARRITRKEN